MSNKAPEQSLTTKAALKELSVKDFMNFGMDHIAYVRAEHDGRKFVYKVHAADGTELLSSNKLEHAVVLTKQRDLEPVVIH